MTQYYHTPIPLLAAATAATFRSPFGELDAAIYRCLGQGTSFPVSATEGDQFWRTDSNKGYLYDGSNWIEISTGGASAGVVDVEGTAGAALSERDYVYLSATDGKWEKVDIDASPVAVGPIRGFVVESGGILEDAVGTIRTAGVLGGFTGLTAGLLVYAHTTAGGYTQTRPVVTDGGAQKAIVIAGQAISTTEVLIMPYHVEYAKRATLANNATLTIEHHADASTRTRLPSATILTSAAGSSLTAYSDTNRDVGVPLRGPSGAGATTTITASGGAAANIGNVGGVSYAEAQGIVATGGRLTQITVKMGATTGSPTGTITWELQTDSSSAPSNTVVQSGTFTPTASATNTITVPDGIILAAGTYQVVLKSTSTQSSNNYWSWQASASSVYASGQLSYAASPYTSWTGVSTQDCECSLTTVAVSVGDKLSQGFQVTGNQTVGAINLYLKKVGSPTGTMTVRVETDSAGMPSGTLVDAAATTTLAESTLATSYTVIAFAYASSYTATGSTQYHIVLSTDRSSSDTNYVLWGADASSPGYASGAMASQASSTWSAETKDAIFDVLGPTTTYDEPCTIGRWSGGTRDCAVRFDDGAASSPTTKTTFKNTTGGSVDMTCIVRLQ